MLDPSQQPDSAWLVAQLKAHFGFDAFRPGQEAVIGAAMSGHNVLGVMPTGSGKSLCYQMLSVLRPGGTLVISPLISLMKDQADSLASSRLRVALLNSTRGRREQEASLREWERGEIDLLYAAPERFRNRRFLNALARHRPQVLAVDEAHCVSQWGHDFRPDYLFLRTAVERLQVPVTVALTATATPDVQQDILVQLGMRDARVIVTGFDRPNLHLEVHRLPSSRAKRSRLKELLLESEGSGIVYTATRKEAQETARYVRSLGCSAAAYDGGMDAQDRAMIQNAFMSGEIPIVCATNAFGLGVNKSDIRFVFHMSLPGTIEALYQEMGRAGRDGKPAHCALLYAPADLPLQRFLIQAVTPTRQDLADLYGFLVSRGPQPEFAWDEPATLMDASDIRVRAALSELEKAGLTRRMADSESGSVRVELLDAANVEAALARRESELNAVRTERMEKLHAVEAYARLTTCRRSFVRRYFGEPNAPEACTNCDVCTPRRTASSQDDENVRRSAEAGLEILRCVAHFSGRLGRTTVAQVLAGSKSKRLEAASDWYADFHGRLSSVPQARIAEALDTLLTEGYIETGVLTRNETAYPVVQIAQRGVDVLNGREAAPAVVVDRGQPARSMAAAPAAPEPTAPADRKLFERLRSWRYQLARDMGRPPYTIVSDAGLREVVAHRPAASEALLNLRGWGPKTVESYGDAVLSMVAAADG